MFLQYESMWNELARFFSKESIQLVVKAQVLKVWFKGVAYKALQGKSVSDDGIFFLVLDQRSVGDR